MKSVTDQPEFIQAAKEVLTTIQPALDAHPEPEKSRLLERLVEPERIVMFRVPGLTTSATFRLIADTASSLTPQLDP